MQKSITDHFSWQITQVQTSSDGVDGESIDNILFTSKPKGDNFTCLEYNGTGELLAAGDKSGRITIFKANHGNKRHYDIYCAFTSHEPEFDYLKSLEIDEKINSITWLPNVTSAHHLLAANDKTIKLWRISERQHEAYHFNTREDEGHSLWINGEVDPDQPGPAVPKLHSSSELRIPRFRRSTQLTVEARPRRVYSDAHVYHINAVSLNSDQETFLSADDLRVNLWHIDVSDQSFTIVDLKPPNMEDLSEVITCARFHPSLCHLFAYSTSRGVIRLCDMRTRALCDEHVLAFEDPQTSQNPSFFADIVASLSDFQFGHTGQYILARDYLTLKVWDVRMGDRPCELYSVHEPLRSQLCMLYENDAIFDKFLCSWSYDDRHIITGSYGNLFRVFDRHSGSDNLFSLHDANGLVSNPDPASVMLTRKAFLSPEDPIGSCLGLTTVCVASMETIENLLSDSSIEEASDYNSSEDSVEQHTDNKWARLSATDDSINGVPTVPQSHEVCSSSVGSKRRKQLLPSRADESSDSPNNITVHHRRKKHRHDKNTAAATDDEGCDTLMNGNANSLLNTLRGKFKRKKLSALLNKFTIGDLSVSNAYQLDCQQKVLHLAWNPHDLSMVLISGSQIFFMDNNGNFECEPASVCCSSPQVFTDVGSDCMANSQSTPEESYLDQATNLQRNLDTKPIRRKRRRQHHSNGLMSDSSCCSLPKKDSLAASVDSPLPVIDPMENACATTYESAENDTIQDNVANPNSMWATHEDSSRKNREPLLDQTHSAATS